ncbi:MAG TPA: alpha/beta hydrolase [Micromonosporaceae bacterium]|nr:alpha/beta hydrolase [Micromonosporaceae bacterium]
MSDRVVFVLPGRAYGVEGPVLYYPAMTAARRRAELRPYSWSRPYGPVDDPLEFVSNEIGPAVREVTASGVRPLVIAKSLGVAAAPIAARLGLPAIWLTPVLTAPSAAEGIGARTAPALIVGGTADRSWDGDVARELSPHVCEIPGADHSLLVDGPISRSLDAMSTVVSAVGAFLDEIGWTAAA